MEKENKRDRSSDRREEMAKLCKKFRRLKRKLKKLSEGPGANVYAQETKDKENEKDSKAHTRCETGTASR